MNAACRLCQGACCKFFILKRDSGYSDDYWRWVQLHSDRCNEDHAQFNIPCKALQNGKCVIYDTRPFVCQMFPVGGPDCRAIVNKTHHKHMAKRILAEME